MKSPARIVAACAILLARCVAEPSPVGARTTAERRAKSPITIASWNLRWLHHADGEGEVPRSAADYALLRSYARRLDADVVALQEVDGEEAARRVFDPAVYSFHFTADADNRQRVGFAFRKTLRATPRPDLAALAIEGKRRGADLEIDLGGNRRLRLLAVHLKAQCADRPLDTDDARCAILARQVPVLEGWIDARAAEGVPFAVAGDFNRVFGPDDDLWRAIDDGDPPGADLLDAGAGLRPPCWGGRFRDYIDHIVLGERAASWLVPGSFESLVYSPSDASRAAVLSDHCPIRLSLAWDGPAPAAATRRGQPRNLRADEAPAHAGEWARVCGTVASARYVAELRDRPTFLNLDRPYPDPAFTVVIRGVDRRRFGRPEKTYAGRAICATGTIELYRGRPQIVAREPSQLELAR